MRKLYLKTDQKPIRHKIKNIMYNKEILEKIFIFLSAFLMQIFYIFHCTFLECKFLSENKTFFVFHFSNE